MVLSTIMLNAYAFLLRMEPSYFPDRNGHNRMSPPMEQAPVPSELQRNDDTYLPPGRLQPQSRLAAEQEMYRRPGRYNSNPTFSSIKDPIRMPAIHEANFLAHLCYAWCALMHRFSSLDQKIFPQIF